MNVAALLKTKGRAVTTASPSTPLIEIVKKLAGKKIGAMVVVGAGGEVAGIISERDIIRAVSQHGPEVLASPVAETMTRKVVTCHEGTTLDTLMEQMTLHRFRHMPVVEDGALIGIVSIGDVVYHHVAEVKEEAHAMREYIAHG